MERQWGHLSRRGDTSTDVRTRREESSSKHSSSHHRKKDRRSSSRDRSRSSHKKHKKEKKSKKKKSRRDSSDSSDESSGDSDSSTELLLRLEKERLELKEKRRREKEKLKDYETPEEKRARRLYKKEVKARKLRQEEGWDDEYIHYTNEDNPFGDPNLTNTFKWGKKLEKEGMAGADDRVIERIQRAKRNEQRLELEKVKQRRLERERQREDVAMALELEQRRRDNEKHSKWQQDEDEFHLKQARLRSKIRIIDGRAKPIDLLAKYVSADEDMDAVEMHEPYTYLNGLTVDDLEDLLVDIGVYKEIDEDKNQDFWKDIVIIVEDELHKLRKMDPKSIYQEAAERRQGINKAVAADVQDVFKGKSSKDLADLQKLIEEKLSDKAEGVDIGYWESLLSQLKAHLARARLRDIHSENLRKKLELLKAEQGVEGGLAERDVSPIPGPSATVTTEDDDSEDEDEDDDPSAAMIDPSLEEYKSGRYSPIYFTQDDLELGTLVISEAEDLAKITIDQSRACRGNRVDNVMSAEEKALEKRAKEGMSGEEATFSVESALEHTYEWSDKYRPRKPRYFNRVHTGFEWNKYNSTHYDMDNPPPKVVQGYKFNIFYPDLIDKASTPSYTLTPCSDNRDFVVLKIRAGPPYEDIAFKIVNREWEYGYKRGFRCQFQNNIFQLWFHFKRLRYRR